MSFGEDYPGIVNPLDGAVNVDDRSKSELFYFNFIV